MQSGRPRICVAKAIACSRVLGDLKTLGCVTIRMKPLTARSLQYVTFMYPYVNQIANIKLQIAHLSYRVISASWGSSTSPPACAWTIGDVRKLTGS